jgi:glutaredoxin
VRVKGHLAARGVEFVAIDVTSDRSALEELKTRGIRGLPVVTVGERHVLGLDLAQVDALIGSADVLVELSGGELVARATRLLAAAARFAYQLPTAHYEDPCPGMENVTTPFVLAGGHVLVLSDGSPYVPHGTFLGIFRHIVCHGEKFRHFVQEPDDDYSDSGLYAQFGEPLPSRSVNQLAELAQTIARDIQQWWQDTGGRDLEHPLATFLGPQTLRQMLQRETYSLTQHTRQLMDVLRRLGIEPDGPIGEREFAGLSIPAGVWD